MDAHSDLIAPADAFHVPRWSRPFTFLARHLKGWNFLLFLVLVVAGIAAVSAPPALVYEMCEGDRFIDDQRTLRCLNTNVFLLGFLEAVAGLVVLVVFALLGAGFGWLGHRKRARRLRRAYEKRIQGVRDHVITGHIGPEGFDEVQQVWKPLVRGEHPAVKARAGTSTAIVFNVLVSLAFGIGLTIYVVGSVVMAAEGRRDTDFEIFTLIWNGIFLPLLGLFLLTLVWGWIRFPRGHTNAVHATDEAIDAAERSEVRIFAAPTNSRRTRTAVAAEGPRFSPYAERSRLE